MVLVGMAQVCKSNTRMLDRMVLKNSCPVWNVESDIVKSERLNLERIHGQCRPSSHLRCIATKKSVRVNSKLV